MADGVIKINVRTDNLKTRLQQKLEVLVNDKETKVGVNKQVLSYINDYVPAESGALRASARVNPDNIVWDTEYAHYQYMGIVYGPNFKKWSGRNIVGWKSPPGSGTKYPTGRELGVPGEWKGWEFGYSTPGTSHHWVREAWANERQRINISVTAYLKRRIREKGL